MEYKSPSLFLKSKRVFLHLRPSQAIWGHPGPPHATPCRPKQTSPSLFAISRAIPGHTGPARTILHHPSQPEPSLGPGRGIPDHPRLQITSPGLLRAPDLSTRPQTGCSCLLLAASCCSRLHPGPPQTILGHPGPSRAVSGCPLAPWLTSWRQSAPKNKSQ